MTYKENDFVRLLLEDPNGINARARVTRVGTGGVWVTNMNQPFCGTYANEYFLNDQVEPV